MLQACKPTKIPQACNPENFPEACKPENFLSQASRLGAWSLLVFLLRPADGGLGTLTPLARIQGSPGLRAWGLESYYSGPPKNLAKPSQTLYLIPTVSAIKSSRTCRKSLLVWGIELVSTGSSWFLFSFSISGSLTLCYIFFFKFLIIWSVLFIFFPSFVTFNIWPNYIFYRLITYSAHS